MTDIFQEVEEEVRRERLEKLWKRYAPLIIGVAVLLVVITAAITGWRAYQQRERAAHARHYLAAAAQLTVSPQAAANAFAELGKVSGGYGVVARFREAEALVQIGKLAEATKVYGKIAADTEVDGKLRDLATLKSAYLTADHASLADLRARLAPLTRAEGPYRHAARELLAFAALANGDRTAAIDGFRGLADDGTAPETARNRAAQMLASLGATPAGKAPPGSAPSP